MQSWLACVVALACSTASSEEEVKRSWFVATNNGPSAALLVGPQDEAVEVKLTNGGACKIIWAGQDTRAVLCALRGVKAGFSLTCGEQKQEERVVHLEAGDKSDFIRLGCLNAKK